MGTSNENRASVVEENQWDSAGAVGLCSDNDLPEGIFTDRRESARRPHRLRTCLMPLRGTDDISCLSDDVSVQGMHVTVPVGYGLAVGQRFELLVAAPGASVGLGPLLVGPGRFATVVRTRLQVGESDGWVGVGLRFDQPIQLD
jgi:hypothetical protein